MAGLNGQGRGNGNVDGKKILVVFKGQSCEGECCCEIGGVLGLVWSVVGSRGGVGGRVQAAEAAAASYFVVDVGRALGWHLLDDVDGMSVVSAHLLVVRAVG